MSCGLRRQAGVTLRRLLGGGGREATVTFVTECRWVPLTARVTAALRIAVETTPTGMWVSVRARPARVARRGGDRGHDGGHPPGAP